MTPETLQVSTYIRQSDIRTHLSLSGNTPGNSTSGIPTLSSNIAHSPSTSNHDAATHSLINKLQCERNALIDKVMELTLQLERERRQPPASVTHTPPTAPAVSSRPVGTCSMKIAIFSDSMCRGVADIMRSLLPQVKITSDIKPGAVFAQVVASIPSQCQNFGPDDFIFIHAGTNDFDDSLQPNSTKRFSLTSPLVDLANKTNVVLCSVPFRFDTVSVNLLSPPSHIPVVTSSHRPSNFSTGDRTLGT
ncbi:hypothetical protein M8J75_013540 [Diaphorina citri]|nr:hypothetical protein M8J75_013540 [Diaphorina citri]